MLIWSITLSFLSTDSLVVNSCLLIPYQNDPNLDVKTNGLPVPCWHVLYTTTAFGEPIAQILLVQYHTTNCHFLYLPFVAPGGNCQPQGKFGYITVCILPRNPSALVLVVGSKIWIKIMS